MNQLQIERALITKYRSKIYSKFCKAISDYELLKENDKIAVCMSGGKDSFVLAKLFQEIVKHGNIKIDVVFLVMNPGFNEENLVRLKENSQKLGIDVIIYESNIFKVSMLYGNGQPCYLCAKMRRGFLYDRAKELGCNKIALGHHFNDVIETTLLNVLYCGTFKTMPPKLLSTNHPGMELIRPMVYIEEKDIIAFMNYCGISAMNCGCSVASGKISSKRKEIKNLIKELKKDFNDVEKCIYKSAENINLNCVMGWNFKDKKYSFLDYYDKEKDE